VCFDPLRNYNVTPRFNIKFFILLIKFVFRMMIPINSNNSPTHFSLTGLRKGRTLF